MTKKLTIKETIEKLNSLKNCVNEILDVCSNIDEEKGYSFCKDGVYSKKYNKYFSSEDSAKLDAANRKKRLLEYDLEPCPFIRCGDNYRSVVNVRKTENAFNYLYALKKHCDKLGMPFEIRDALNQDKMQALIDREELENAI